jgi:pimeloyl-ACP methyl ester carboxylesterase
MARRIDVTGAGGVRLAAWEFGPPRAAADRTAVPRAFVPAQAQPYEAHETCEVAETLEGSVARGAAEVGRVRQAGAPEGGREDARPGVLLLHGLMGRASHWAATARWLADRYRVVALDLRGHGHSEKPPPAAYTREAYTEDVEAAVEQLGLGPAVVIGHAMGALTAWQLAARRPDLVRALVVCDMRASALGAASQREWESWFKAWPLPFATLEAARTWFAEQDPWVDRPSPARGAFYAEVLHECPDGWRPVFDPEHMLVSRETWAYDAHWDELALVRCPALVVRGLDGELGRAEAQEMVRVLPRGQYAEIPDAGHYLHYERPEAWRAVVEPFLDGVLAS